MKAQADALGRSGLKDHGFVYINLDDFWQKCDSNGFSVDYYGRWAVDTAKFPSGIKALADYIHSKGLKFGFYVTPGIAKNAVTKNTPIEGTSYHAKDIADTSKTEKNYNCKNMYYIDYSKPGAQEFVNSWARQFASWGVDYLKIDGVGSQDIPDVQAWDKALRPPGGPSPTRCPTTSPSPTPPPGRQLANSWRTRATSSATAAPDPTAAATRSPTGRTSPPASTRPPTGSRTPDPAAGTTSTPWRSATATRSASPPTSARSHMTPVGDGRLARCCSAPT